MVLFLAIFICRGLFNITFSQALLTAVGKPNKAAPKREKDRNLKKKKSKEVVYLETIAKILVLVLNAVCMNC